MSPASRVTTLVGLLCMATGAAAFSQSRGDQPRSRSFNVDALTASITGRITTADTGAPLRRVEVRAIGESGISRLTTTDGDGWYQVRDLPAGTFTVHAAKTGFVPLYHGQRRPFERRATISLAEGQRATVNLALPRAGAITGRVVDGTGEPVMGARVQAMRIRMVNGQRGLQSVGAGDTTDDMGAYRLYALPPGDYFVTVLPRRVEPRPGVRTQPTQSADATLIYFPGTASRQEAQRIAVGASSEARADVHLVSIRASTISGTILTSAGAPAAGAMVGLMADDLQLSPEADALRMMQLRDDAGADGSFEIVGVPPGVYTLRVQYVPRMQVFDTAAVRAGMPPQMESASLPLTVDGDLTGVSLFTAPGGTFEITFERDRVATTELPRGAQLSIRSGERLEMMRMASPDGKIALSSAGPARVAVTGLPENWMLKAILLDGDDVTDQQIEVRGRTANLRVVLTDRITEVAGTVASSAFAASPAPPATVVIFSDDPQKWSYPSRFIRSERTGDDGTFRVTGLPPGDDYRIVAVDYLEAEEETDPDFLQRMRDRATRFSLNEAERRTIDLRVIQR